MTDELRVDWVAIEHLVDAAVRRGTITASRGAEILGLRLQTWRDLALDIRDEGNPLAAPDRPTAEGNSTCLADTVPADRHPKACNRWFASDQTTGEAICDCGLAAESTVEGLYQHDLAAILRALGLGDHARGDSPHMVVHDVVLPGIRALADRPTAGHAAPSSIEGADGARTARRRSATQFVALTEHLGTEVVGGAMLSMLADEHGLFLIRSTGFTSPPRAPSVSSIDVERLARALRQIAKTTGYPIWIEIPDKGNPSVVSVRPDHKATAEAVVAEYERLGSE